MATARLQIREGSTADLQLLEITARLSPEPAVPMLANTGWFIWEKERLGRTDLEMMPALPLDVRRLRA